jgi:3-deoxy-D-arabino-heptulosonate 7-phosphate (DAHP) synthase
MKNLEMIMELATVEATKKSQEAKEKAQAKQKKAEAMKKEAELLLNNAELLLDESHDAWEEHYRIQEEISEANVALEELKEKSEENPLAGILVEALIFGSLKGGLK